MGYRRKNMPKSTYQRRYQYKKNRKSKVSVTQVPSIPRGFALKKHHFKQQYLLPDAALLKNGVMSYNPTKGDLFSPIAGTIDGTFQIVFRAIDIPQWGQFSALFDCYKINKVVVKFIPQVNSLTASSTANNNILAKQSFMSTVIDYDDSTALGSYSALLEYENAKETPMYKKHVRVITPAVSASVFKTSGTTIGYSQKRKQWIDAAYADVEHYGLKGYLQADTNLLQQTWKVLVTMYISFKQVR